MLRDLDQKTDQIKHNYRNELKNNNEENDSITESLANFNEDYLDSLNELKPMFQRYGTFNYNYKVKNLKIIMQIIYQFFYSIQGEMETL
jgi:hypothetical protein